MLTWIHVGDLHATQDDGYQSVARLRALVGEANRYLRGAVDFVFLPGDNANNGTAAQYHRIGEVLRELAIPVHAIPGDHDFESGTLDAFHAMPGADRLPKVVQVDGRRCLFLDIVSAGSGGPDFRLGERQRRWLEDELSRPAPPDRRPLVFMHAYPGDLHVDGEALGRLFAQAQVALIDTGHTHYNELLNDGAAIYAATRSTGQVEEGDGQPGYSLVAVDGAAVSWRFKPLDSAWPFVLITHPADRRLTRDAAWHEHLPGAALTVRAKVFGDDIAAVSVCLDQAQPVPMRAVEGEPAVWAASLTVPAGRMATLIVRARGADGASARDRIEIPIGSPASSAPVRADALPGTDAHAVEPWPEHGVLGSQLGPNKHGRKW